MPNNRIRIARARAASTRIARPLLRWYDRSKRDLPWRRDPTPYKTLVSEIMSQQTAVATVGPYFERFLQRFPALGSLAAATDDEVTALWSGLGYYARARNLRRAAAVVVAEHGGELPRTEAELRGLPGVGPYTAAAVAAIAFGARAFALDGNAMRVLTRLYRVGTRIDLPSTRARLHALGLAEVPRGRAGDFNQAVMELGATVCTPRQPRCEVCPLRAVCRARAAGVAESLPRRATRAARPIVRVVCVCVTDGARVLMVKRPAGLLAGTWALPDDESVRGAVPPAEVARRVAARAGVRADALEYRGAVRHVFTHRDVTAEVYRIEVPARDPSVPGRRWVAAAGLASLGVSSFTRKTIALGGSFAKQDRGAVRP
ncbi:MAG TPA: A/G-specific adenine glycosylase [Polyangia bacterium]